MTCKVVGGRHLTIAALVASLVLASMHTRVARANMGRHTYLVFSTKPECVDYYIGQPLELEVPEPPPAWIELDYGGANDDIWCVLDEGTTR